MFMILSPKNCADQNMTFRANEHQIERVKLIRDLGVNILQIIPWDFHIDITVKNVFNYPFVIDQFCMLK